MALVCVFFKLFFFFVVFVNVHPLSIVPLLWETIGANTARNNLSYGRSFPGCSEYEGQSESRRGRRWRGVEPVTHTHIAVIDGEMAEELLLQKINGFGHIHPVKRPNAGSNCDWI